MLTGYLPAIDEKIDRYLKQLEEKTTGGSLEIRS
jgi:hypothetical protein